jgi:hypothetical protein
MGQTPACSRITILTRFFNWTGFALMSPLNIHPEEDLSKSKKKNNKLLKILLGVSALIVVPAIGTTLAANISISSGTVQFGQGTATAAACDSTITIVPNASFNETSNYFTLGSVTVSDLDWASCAGKTLRFRFYATTAGSNDLPYTVASSGTTNDALIFTLGSGGYTIAKTESGADYTVSTLTSSSSSTGTFTVTLVTKPATTSIDRITVESY